MVQGQWSAHVDLQCVFSDKVSGLGTEIRRELVPQDCVDELYGRSTRTTRRTRPKWYLEKVMCWSPSAVTSNPQEEDGEEGARSGEQTTTDKDEELDVNHVLHGGEAELLKYRAGAHPRWQTEEAGDIALRWPCQGLHVANC